jgi:CrcB protein
MNYLILGIGGAFGSITRYKLGMFVIQKSKANMGFPLGTFIINISGAFLLGIINGLNIDGNMYLLVADGFLGAYTTFSTFMYESFSLVKDNKILNATIYVLFSLMLGFLGFILGYMCCKIIFR